MVIQDLKIQAHGMEVPYSSVGYAVEKKENGDYILVIKFTETFDLELL